MQNENAAVAVSVVHPAGHLLAFMMVKGLAESLMKPVPAPATRSMPRVQQVAVPSTQSWPQKRTPSKQTAVVMYHQQLCAAVPTRASQH